MLSFLFWLKADVGDMSSDEMLWQSSSPNFDDSIETSAEEVVTLEDSKLSTLSP